MNIKSLISGFIFIVLMDLFLFQVFEKEEKTIDEPEQCTLAKLSIQTDVKPDPVEKIQKETPTPKSDKPIYVCTDWFKFVTINEPDITQAHPIEKNTLCE